MVLGHFTHKKPSYFARTSIQSNGGVYLIYGRCMGATLASIFPELKNYYPVSLHLTERNGLLY